MSDNNYKEGYGQCKADLLIMIKEGMRSVRKALDVSDNWDVDKEGKTKLKLRLEELHRLRAYVKTLKPKR
jgi:hypothetical protein